MDRRESARCRPALGGNRCHWARLRVSYRPAAPGWTVPTPGAGPSGLGPDVAKHGLAEQNTAMLAVHAESLRLQRVLVERRLGAAAGETAPDDRRQPDGASWGMVSVPIPDTA